MNEAQLDSWIVEQTSDALIYADVEGIIRRWNAGAEMVFGFSKADALGQYLDLIIPEHLRERHWQGFDAAMASGHLKLDGKPTLTRGLHQHKPKIYVEMSFGLVKNDQGKAIGSVAMARDVTERVEKERAARRRTAKA